MVWKARLYESALVSVFGGPSGGRCTDWLSDTIKVSLHTSASNALSGIATLDSWDDVTNQVTNTGYTSGGATLSSKTLAYSATYRTVKVNAASPNWGHNNFTTPAFAVIYNATPADKPVLGVVDFGSTIGSTNTADPYNYGVIWNQANGIFQFSTRPVSSNPTTQWYGRTWLNAFGGPSSGDARMTDWTQTPIVVTLHRPAYVPDLDADGTSADLTDEVSGTGYTSGDNILTGTSVEYSGGKLRLKADNAVFPTGTDVGLVRWAVVQDWVGGALLGLIDLGGVYVTDGLTLHWIDDDVLTMEHAW